MVQDMYENSPENFKKFQKRFKYTICDTEPKIQDSGIENYAYGYHSSSTVMVGCSFGSSLWHLIFVSRFNIFPVLQNIHHNMQISTLL